MIVVPGSGRVHDTALRELATALKAPSVESLRVVREPGPFVSGAIFVGLVSDLESATSARSPG